MYHPSLPKRIYHQSRRLIAKHWHQLFPNIKTYGITGSYGKTNTSKVIDAILSYKFKTLTTDTNLDTTYNLPITLLKLRPSHQRLILEYGIDQIGEMDKHLQLVRPDIAILTGITPVHTDDEHLGSLENLIQEKAKLLHGIKPNGLAIVNGDDSHTRQIAKNLQCPYISYGTTLKSDIQAQKIKVTTSGTTMTIKLKKKIKSLLSIHHKLPMSIDVKIGLIGHQFAHTAMIGLIAGLREGIEIKHILTSLAGIKPLPGRMSFEPGPLNTWLLNDSLRSNLASALAGIKTFDQIKTTTLINNKIVVMGEMGEISDKLKTSSHQEVGQVIGKAKTINQLIAIGPLMKHAAKAAIDQGMVKSNVHIVDNPYQAGHILKKTIKPNDFIYLKGSLLRHMERVILILEDEPVGCQVVSCPFYRSCQTCKYLETGFTI